MAKASRFFGVYAPAIYVLERHNLADDYALIGGYACRYWSKYYSRRHIKNFTSRDIDLRGEKDPVAITLRDFWPAQMPKESEHHADNPDSETWVLKKKLSYGDPAKAEVIKLVPTLDLNSPIAQGIAYRVPCYCDSNLTVSVLDPCSLFVSKLPAYQDIRRRNQRDKETGEFLKHDGEHLELLAGIMKFFLEDSEILPQAENPRRDPRVAANRLLESLNAPNKRGKLPDLPEGINAGELVDMLKGFTGVAKGSQYAPVESPEIGM